MEVAEIGGWERDREEVNETGAEVISECVVVTGGLLGTVLGKDW